jgi:hypothetical protein
MERFSNFIITSNDTLSREVIENEILNFKDLVLFIKKLPYGRNSDRSDYSLVFKEQKGTCSTKHAYLSKIALENHFPVTLYIGIYKMNGLNTNGIDDVLKTYQLDYIPEAHCYLKFENEILDCTRNVINDISFEESILYEENILPEQIGEHKVTLHKNYLKKWISENSIPYNLQEIWQIRELCIASLKQ